MKSIAYQRWASKELQLNPELITPERIKQRLSQPLPSIASCSKFAPELCYGRHQGPPTFDTRQAAVLLLMYRQSGACHIPLTVRPAAMTSHGGQVSLPGGQIEPGESVEQAALREYHEELGVSPSGAQLLGRLSGLYVFASGFYVTPVVAWLEERPPFKPNPAEVANLLEPKLVELMSSNNHGEHLISRRSVKFRAPHIEYDEYKIWGATCTILGEFFQVIEAITD